MVSMLGPKGFTPCTATRRAAYAAIGLLTISGAAIGGPARLLAASANARPPVEGFKLSTIELGIRIVAPRSLVVS
jgi:hypothetical protein